MIGRALTLTLLLGSAGHALAQEPAPPAPPPANALEELERAVCDVVERVRPSVVQVTMRRGAEAIATSGIVWSPDGHVVSLGRAFEMGEAFEVVLASGEKRTAALVGTDDETGIALLKIDPASLGAPLQAAPLGSSARLRAGAFAIAITNPFGLQGSAALGTVAGRDRVVRRAGRPPLSDVLQITTPVNPGDPGGALADARGQVVGIVASTYERPLLDADTLARFSGDLAKIGESFLGKDSDKVKQAIELLLSSSARQQRASPEARYAGTLAPFSGQGIGFAIPIDHARSVVERLRSEGKVERAWVGVTVTPMDTALKAVLAHDGGVLVIGVQAGSPAETAGLQKYDIVVRFAGRDVSDIFQFQRMVREAPPGRPVAVEVVRERAPRRIEVTPATRGGPREGAPTPPPQTPPAPPAPPRKEQVEEKGTRP